MAVLDIHTSLPHLVVFCLLMVFLPNLDIHLMRLCPWCKPEEVPFRKYQFLLSLMWKRPGDQVTATPSVSRSRSPCLRIPLSLCQVVPALLFLGCQLCAEANRQLFCRRGEDRWRLLGPLLLRNRVWCYGVRVQLGFWVAPEANKWADDKADFQAGPEAAPLQTLLRMPS